MSRNSFGSKVGSAASGLHLLWVVLAVAAAPSPPSSPAVHVFIPPDMDAGNLRIGVGIYGQGLQTGDQPGEEGVHEYSIPCATSDTVKLFAYLPGYRIEHIDHLRAGDSWSPAFEPLPSATLEGKFVDTSGNPLPGETLVLTYCMDEAASFFGYSDGGVPVLPVATAQTRDDGTFQVLVPALESDPFFGNPPFPEPRRMLDVGLAPVQPRWQTPWVLAPAHVPLQNDPAAPLVIQRVGKGTLRGRISEEFLRRNGITGVVREGGWPEEETGCRLELSAASGAAGAHWNCDLKPDLSFSAILPPGRYDLQLSEMKRGYLLHQAVPVKTGVVLEESGLVDLVAE